MANVPALSVMNLFAERDAQRRRDQEAVEQLQRKKEEELAAYRQRLENFQLTDAITKSGLDRIRRAFERGETELMISSFPSSFCSDGGRAVINAGAPPINKPTKAELAARSDEPEWLGTLPAGVRQVHEYWKENLKPGGFSSPPASSISRRQAGRYRPVLLLAEERLGSVMRSTRSQYG